MGKFELPQMGWWLGSKRSHPKKAKSKLFLIKAQKSKQHVAPCYIGQRCHSVCTGSSHGVSRRAYRQEILLNPSWENTSAMFFSNSCTKSNT